MPKSMPPHTYGNCDDDRHTHRRTYDYSIYHTSIVKHDKITMGMYA